MTGNKRLLRHFLERFNPCSYGFARMTCNPKGGTSMNILFQSLFLWICPDDKISDPYEAVRLSFQSLFLWICPDDNNLYIRDIKASCVSILVLMDLPG